MNIKSDPSNVEHLSTIDHLIRMEMAEQEYNESIREAEERGEEKGREEGAHNKAIEIAKNLLRAGVASTIVSTSSGLSLSEVQALHFKF